MIRPRRSPLFMPGSNARAIEKARTLPADAIILDLEDSVAPDAKASARDQIAREVAKGGFGKRELLIRVNHLQSPWWQDDFAMTAKAKPDGILVPKILGPDDISVISRKLDELGADPKTRVWVMIETPLAVVTINEIAARALDKTTRLEAFVIGPNDIALETRIRMRPGRAAMIRCSPASFWQHGPMASKFSTAPTATSVTHPVSRRNVRRRETSASTARR